MNKLDWFEVTGKVIEAIESQIPAVYYPDDQYWVYREVIVDLDSGLVEALNSRSGKWHKAQLPDVIRSAPNKSVPFAIKSVFKGAEIVYI